MICDRIIRGVAPMARRMPISEVRSRTVTIMMFDTPITPASRVPIPISQMRMFTPLNRLSIMAKNISVLRMVTAFSSVGSTWCPEATAARIFGRMSLITTPSRAVTAITSTASPLLYRRCTVVMGITTASSPRPLMFTTLWSL